MHGRGASRAVSGQPPGRAARPGLALGSGVTTQSRRDRPAAPREPAGPEPGSASPPLDLQSVPLFAGPGAPTPAGPGASLPRLPIHRAPRAGAGAGAGPAAAAVPRLSQPGDPLELEADRIADAVMRAPAGPPPGAPRPPTPPATPPAGGDLPVQRACAACERDA